MLKNTAPPEKVNEIGKTTKRRKLAKFDGNGDTFYLFGLVEKNIN